MPETKGRRIRVRGLVQGVGFRPHVWRIARTFGLSGRVLNDGAGVEIEIWGRPAELDRFLKRLDAEPPPLSRIDGIETEALAGAPPAAGFRIAESGSGPVATGIVPDAATCPACLAEIADPGDRRYRYPFTNCTHCGPRLSIVHAIPYDRATTSMNVFEMCADCRAEYEDPADRRFHAQPNACPACGPKVWLEDRAGPLPGADPIAETAEHLQGGAIVAVKGIGGFHLACDATDDRVVDELRRRKRRADKPLALMAADLMMARQFAEISAEEEAALESAAAPIVLVRKAGQKLAAGIAPGQDHVGFMLPYTPLHHLLMQRLDRPIVLTSGNLSDEPQVTGNDAARERLAGIADFWLMHDREIVNRLDDSVMRCDETGPAILRRGRGLAPEPLALPEGFEKAPNILAMGGELKSTFCLMAGGRAVLSQHIGDLEEAGTHADYRRTLALYRHMFAFDPDVIAVDQHPDYLSTQWGEALAEETGAAIVAVQHHHAHLAACLAENGVAPGDDHSLGIVLDGLGLGDDGTIWGGEFLVGGYSGYRRAGHFLPVALPGAAQAMHEPWRNAVAHLRAAFGAGFADRLAGTGFADFLQQKPLDLLDRMIESGVNAPLASSAGRLFDAAAALVGLCPERQGYEGQAAMELEASARPFLAEASAYPAEIGEGDPVVLSWAPMWAALVDDLAAGAPVGLIAARFHNGLIEAVAGAAERIARDNGVDRIVLSGGVLQNKILAEGLTARLAAAGFAVLCHHHLPANDGGLALGQAAIAALR